MAFGTVVQMDGFGTYLAPVALTNLVDLGRWSEAFVGTGQDAENIVDDLAGGRMFRISSFSTNWWRQGLIKDFTANNEVMTSAYMRIYSSPAGNLWNFYGGEMNGLAQVRLVLTGGLAALKLVAHNYTVLATGPDIPLGTWFHIETYLKIHDTTGRFIVKLTPLGGATTTVIDFTGDTKSSAATSTCGAASFMGDRGDLGDAFKELKDVVIRVGADTFLGPTRVKVLRPNGAGSYAGLTPTPAIANYRNTMEIPQDSDVTYVSGAASVKDSYNFTSLKAGDVVHFAQLRMVSRKDDGAARSIAAFAKTGGEVQGATQAITATQAGYIEMYPTDPADASVWTVDKINAAQFGAVVVA